MDEWIPLLEFSRHSRRDCVETVAYAHIEVGLKIWFPHRRLAGGPFDAVLADCEGAFVDVVRDFPELLDRASWVCVEWDQPSNRNWVAEVRPALLRAGLAPLDCGDRRCACDEPRFAPSFRAQGAPTFHEVFVRTGCVRCAD